MTIEQLKAISQRPTQEEMDALSYQAAFYLDSDDMTRLILYRRAVKAGFYNEGFDQDDSLYFLPGIIPAKGQPHMHSWRGRWIECNQLHPS